MSEAQEKFSKVFCDIFEEFSFMFGENSSKEDLSPSEKNLTVNIDFTGETKGTMELVVPEEMCVPIAANFLGVEEDDDFVKTRGPDVLKELINVICGNFLTAHFGEDPVFDLSIPKVSDLAQNEWSDFLNDPDVLGFLVEDYSVLLKLTLEEV